MARWRSGLRPCAARTGLKLPDAFALATVAHAERGGSTDVSLASFDTKVLKAHAALRTPG